MTTKLNEATSHRVEWVDFARVLSMAFIFQLHSGVGYARTPLLAGAACFLFFFLAGYFNRATGIKLVKRCIIILVCSLFWVWIRCCLLTHSPFLPDDFFTETYIWKYRATQWFLQYLALWLLLTPLYLKLPRIIRRITLATLGVLYVYLVVLPQGKDQHISYLGSAFFFYLGCSCQSLELRYLPGCLFPYLRGKGYLYALWITVTLLIGMVVLNAFQTDFVQTYTGCLMALGAYILLCCSYCAEKVYPRFASWVAKAGPSVIFMYIIHPPVVHAWTGGWIMLFGEWPPSLLTGVLFIIMFVGSPYVYRLLVGRWRVMDIIFFAK